jgi:hypothetical protein
LQWSREEEDEVVMMVMMGGTVFSFPEEKQTEGQGGENRGEVLLPSTAR